MILINELMERLKQARVWVALQFGLTLLLLLVGAAWTRLPDKHVWQVALTLLIPVLLVISFLELQAGTMRKLAADDGKRVKLVWGAMALLVWIAVGAVCWALLDWCDDQIPQWAGYLNSRASANGRVTVFSYEHLQSWMTALEWFFRWVAVPAKIVPYALASSQWAWRLPVRRILRILWNWRWWLGFSLAAFVGVWLPGRFFAGTPHGSVALQISSVSLKLAAAYVLAIGCWVLVLGWAATLLNRQPEPPETSLDFDLFRRLRIARVWIGAQFGWVLLLVAIEVAVALLPDGLVAPGVVILPAALVLLIAALIVQASTLRSLMDGETRRVRPIWCIPSMLAFTLPVLVVWFLLDAFSSPFVPRAVCWLVVPGLVLPFAFASALWAMRLPLRRVLRILGNWRWWLAVFTAAVLGIALPAVFALDAIIPANQAQLWSLACKHLLSNLFTVCCWVLLMGWAAVLFGRQLPPPTEESLVAVPVPSGPPSDSQRAKADEANPA